MRLTDNKTSYCNKVIRSFLSPFIILFPLVFTCCKLNKLVREKMDFSSVFFARVDEIGASISFFCYPFYSTLTAFKATLLFTFHPRLSAFVVTIRGKVLESEHRKNRHMCWCVSVCARAGVFAGSR